MRRLFAKFLYDSLYSDPHREGDDPDPDPPEPECEGALECEGCYLCLGRVTKTREVVARAPRSEAGRARRAVNGIRPGDTITVTTGFEFQKNGGRVRYLAPHEVLVSRGPAWSPDEREQWELEKRTRKVGPSLSIYNFDLVAEAREFEDRTGLRLQWGTWENAAATTEMMEQRVAKHKARERAIAQQEAEWAKVLAAQAGSEVEFRGQTWIKGESGDALIYYSRGEYYGQLCDAVVQQSFRLTPKGGGDPVISYNGRRPD